MDAAIETATVAAVHEVVNEVFDIDFPATLVRSWLVPSGVSTDTAQQLTLTLPFAIDVTPRGRLRQALNARQVNAEQLALRCDITPLKNSQPELPRLHGNVILISSGKGGVGKSSVTALLAIALQQLGAQVGVLDADIYGPSMPTMFGGADERLAVGSDNKFTAIMRHGVALTSLGYLTDTKDAAIWRGPMASAALQQLFRDTKWPKLDYLLVDLPPGTGDIQLTFAQKLPITGAVVVTTPQTIALADAEKGISMFRKVGVPITGLIENMSYFECRACGERDMIFGMDGGRQVAANHQVPLLGQLPLQSDLRESLDNGLPLTALQPDHPLADRLRHSAEQLAAHLYQQRYTQT